MLGPEARNVGVEFLALDCEVVVAQPGLDPIGGSVGAARPGTPVRVVGGQLRGELDRRGAVEGRRETWMLESDGLADAECGDEERHGDAEPGGSIDTA